MKRTSRRRFLKNTAVATSAAFAARSIPGWGGSRALVAAGSTKAAVVPEISQFGYSQVQLLDGPFRRQFEQQHDLFLHLNEDAMLKPFRQREGMAAPGPDMGGWYDDANDFNTSDNFHSFIAGHSFGQYVSGLSRAYAITGSKPTQEKVHRLVRGFAETVHPEGKFYVDYRLPAYTYEKTLGGLVDAHEFAGDATAMDVLMRATQAAMPHLPEKALSRAAQRARPHKDISYTWDETYTLPENLFIAYQRSGDARFKDLAVRFVEDDYFGPLAEGRNVLPGEHAYSHVNAFSSAMQSYLVLGDEKYLRAAVNGFRMVQEQSFATGGWGPDEAFVVPGSGGLGTSLDTTHNSFETPCGAYGHFKAARYLLRATKDSKYGDSMERVLYNTIGGATATLADGTTFYYSDYNKTAKKAHYGQKWPCCSGTFPQLAADYGISSYLQGKDGVYVNLYLPSRVSWSQGGTQVSITQVTEYPRASTTQLQVTAAKPESFTVHLRIPAWAGARTIVSVNGGRFEGEMTPGKFVAVRRTWKDGDRIEMEFQMPLYLEAIDAENPNLVALMRGPLAMFGVGEMPKNLARAQLLAATGLAQMSDDYVAKTDSRDFVLRPFMAIMAEGYRLYQPVQG
jgi:uncharacterized protein